MTLSNCWVGKTTSTTANVMVASSGNSSARLKVATNTGLTTSPVFTSAITPDASGLSLHQITGLSANTVYYYGVELDGTLTNDGGSVKTFPSAAASFTFGFGSCQDSANSTVWARLLARNPLLFMHVGDLWYDDGAATTQASYLTHYNTQLNGNLGDFAKKVPMAYTWSDHDSGMNNNAVGGTSGGRAAYAQRAPYWEHPDSSGNACYQQFYVTPRVQFISTDNRSFKSSNSATDNSSKTVLGSAQKTWFKNAITNSTASLIFWANEQPWIGAKSSPDDEWFAYDTERQELGGFIKASGKNVVILSGDMHSIAADDGSNSVGGMAVLHSAPIYNSASSKGGPYSEGRYGTGTCQQYGTVQVTDTGGSTIGVAYTGYDTSDTARITLSRTYSATATASGSPLSTTVSTTGAGSTAVQAGSSLQATVSTTGAGYTNAAVPTPVKTGSRVLVATNGRAVVTSGHVIVTSRP